MIVKVKAVNQYLFFYICFPSCQDMKQFCSTSKKTNTEYYNTKWKGCYVTLIRIRILQLHLTNNAKIPYNCKGWI